MIQLLLIYTTLLPMTILLNDILNLKDLENTKIRFVKGNGKMYVGSASGEDMIYGRWSTYIKNGHGGNAELRTLDFSHIKDNFYYSILDIYKSATPDEIILKRESWWKKTLQSRAFGYNKN